MRTGTYRSSAAPALLLPRGPAVPRRAVEVPRGLAPPRVAEREEDGPAVADVDVVLERGFGRRAGLARDLALLRDLERVPRGGLLVRAPASRDFAWEKR